MAPICSTACHFHPCPRSGLVCDRLEECEAAAREVQLAAPALVPVVVPTASADTAAALFVPCPHHSSISPNRRRARFLGAALARQHGAARSHTCRKSSAIGACAPIVRGYSISINERSGDSTHGTCRVQRQRCTTMESTTTMSRRYDLREVCLLSSPAAAPGASARPHQWCRIQSASTSCGFGERGKQTTCGSSKRAACGHGSAHVRLGMCGCRAMRVHARRGAPRLRQAGRPSRIRP